MAHPHGQATISELEANLAGRAVRPEGPTYENARRIWNGATDKRPADRLSIAGRGEWR